MSNGDNPAYLGTVLYVEDGYVYTIEGNSGGRVAVQRYSLNAPASWATACWTGPGKRETTEKTLLR